MAYDSDPSLCLARLLDTKTGTEHDVKLTKNLWRFNEYCWITEIGYRNAYLTGSKADGSYIGSSDIDSMVGDPRLIKVLESVPLDMEHLIDKEVLLMRRDGCRPGYVILQVLRGHRAPLHLDAYVMWNNCTVLSSVLVANLKPSENHFPNGPCFSNNVLGRHQDQAYYCESKQWPMEANEFFKRSRQNGWPSQQLLGMIKRNGCKLVAIGDKTSDLFAIQWLISFADVEVMLVRSFNHTQLRVYVLMKIFLKQLIEQYDEAKDLLCSYFMKTTMFYMIEDTDPSIWREENLISLFWRCFMKLVQWVDKGYCPHYFIPENNLFKSKICGANQANLRKVLNEIIQEGWKSIYRCYDLNTLQDEWFNIELFNLTKGKSYKEGQLDGKVLTYMFQDGFLRNINGMVFPVERAFQLVMNFSKILSSRSERDINTVMSRVFLGSIGKHIFLNIDHRYLFRHLPRNKKTYKSIKMSENLLFEGAKVDISQGPLNLALFYYAMKRYCKVIHICNKVLSSITSATLDVTNTDCFASYADKFCGRRIGFVEKMKKAVAISIHITRSCERFYPKELIHEVSAKSLPAIPAVPFAVFLKCLCFHEIGDIDSCLSAIHDLKQSTSQIQSRYPLVLKLLAICQDNIGDTAGAVEARRRALQLETEPAMPTLNT